MPTTSVPTSPPWTPFSGLVTAAVCEERYDDLVALLSTSGSRKRLREGFVIGSDGGNTFARLCLRLKDATALHTVLAAAPDGITLADCTTWEMPAELGGLEMSSTMSLHEEAVAELLADFLEVALEFGPTDPCINATGNMRFNGASLHYQAVLRTVLSKDAAVAARAADCARLLLAHGAFFTHESSTVSDLTELFCGFRWNADGTEHVVVPLMGDYVRAGLLPLDEPTKDSSMRPAARAAMAGNGPAAAAAIDLGCDLTLAAKGSGFPDLLEAAANGVTPHMIDATRAYIAAALMRRTLASAVPASPTTAVAHRRAARACL